MCKEMKKKKKKIEKIGLRAIAVVCIKGYPRNFIGMLLWVVRVVICNDFVRKHFLNYFQSLIFIPVEDAS